MRANLNEDLCFSMAHDARCRERREGPRQALRQHISDRCNKICLGDGQKWIRDFEVVA